ncbi:putative baseplate assembly protein [Halosimplex amylolyticum]|uniref:putative baseplate assembly protein n=1 Tax=Halosimplex amylolyticum TaxID=3396616 RepID=UPI003F542B2C
MSEPPDVDGRDRDAILSHLTAIAPYYTAEWDPTAPGPGTTLAALFAEMAEDVVDRLDRVPEKHQIAFFDALGFDRQPPQPARLPVAFAVADGARENAVVDGGTRVVASAADSRPEQPFTVPDDQRFEATPANLQALYGVDPTVDRVCDHWAPASDDGLAVGGDQRLFAERNQQRHVLYVGDTAQLNVEQPEDDGRATIRLRLSTDADADVVERLDWQYYGEAPVETGTETETVERWHRFYPVASVDTASTDGEVVLDLAFDGTLTETAVDGVESRWIRAVVPSLHEADAIADLRLGTDVGVGPGPVRGTDGSGGGGGGGGDGGEGPTKEMTPDRLLYDDVPLPFDDDDADGVDGGDDGTYYPLGTAPQRQSTFYVAADEALSKSGSTLELGFEGLGLGKRPDVKESDAPIDSVLGDRNPEGWVREVGQPDLSWEYWDGEGWSRIEGLADGTGDLVGGDQTVRFPVPDDLAETSVAGHENRWIRCRLVGGSYGTWKTTGPYGAWESTHVVFPPRFDSLTISYAQQPEQARRIGTSYLSYVEEARTPAEPTLSSASATHLLAENHLAVSDLTAASGGRVRPFRRLPDESQTLYFGFDAPLRGGPLTLFVDVDDQQFPNKFHPRVRWEYCVDPEGQWVELDVRDGTESLTERGIVRLVLPGETAPHSLFGTERHWIRARVTGHPFETTALPGWLGNLRFPIGELPVDEFPIDEIPIGELPVDGFPSDEYPLDRVPIGELPSDEYPIGDLPIEAFPVGRVPLGDLPIEEYPIGALPADEFPIEEYPIDESPIAEFATGEYTSGEFPRGEFRSGGSGRFDLDDGGFRTDGGVETVRPCGRTLETEPPAGEPTRRPPLVTDVSPNAAWAANVRLVERETLGSSDGDPSQSFETSTAPVLDETVWVDELARLSEGQRTALREAESPTVEVETAPDGTVDRFWVTWTPVGDFLDSGPEDRHYVVDRTAGRVTFGDGTRGRVPPRGTDSVEVRYRTGGGPDGNVAAGAVDGLQNAIQYVEGVTNPAPGSGGAPAESSREVVSRAPGRLRDRDRAVAAADYERIATDSARGLARARCIPEMDRGGDYEPGWVTLLVVPDAPRDRPVPSTGLKAQVEAAVAERAPATLVAADRLVVRGPSYVSASVDATLVAAQAGGVATLEESAAGAVASFLHPLSGGEDGDGWAFGDLPTMSDLYAVLEGVDGVDHVADLSVTFASSEGATTVREGDESPSVSADALVHSGTHDVTVRLGSTGAGSGEAER